MMIFAFIIRILNILNFVDFRTLKKLNIFVFMRSCTFKKMNNFETLKYYTIRKINVIAFTKFCNVNRRTCQDSGNAIQLKSYKLSHSWSTNFYWFKKMNIFTFIIYYAIKKLIINLFIGTYEKMNISTFIHY